MDRDDKNIILDKFKNLKSVVDRICNLKDNVNTNIELLDLNDESILEDVSNDLVKYQKEIEELDMFLLLDGDLDKNNCIMVIHSGAGGTEACDWADMLFRMYTRFFDSNNYKYKILDIEDGLEAGIKSVTLKIEKEYAYGFLKGEKGVHRLVRLSPFDSNHKRHTSFASVDIIPEIDNDIDINILEKDLKIDVYRSSGKGGQGVNTTDSAVRITHLPTKIVVTCQNERSQIQNKEKAMKILKSKLYALEKEKQDMELNKIQGNYENIEFGSQIRSYVMHPYSLVKDHSTEFETSNVNKVMDGDIFEFLYEYLKYLKK